MIFSPRKFFDFTKRNIAGKRHAGKFFLFYEEKYRRNGYQTLLLTLKKNQWGHRSEDFGGGKNIVLPRAFPLGGANAFFAPPLDPPLNRGN